MHGHRDRGPGDHRRSWRGGGKHAETIVAGDVQIFDDGGRSVDVSSSEGEKWCFGIDSRKYPVPSDTRHAGISRTPPDPDAPDQPPPRAFSPVHARYVDHSSRTRRRVPLICAAAELDRTVLRPEPVDPGTGTGPRCDLKHSSVRPVPSRQFQRSQCPTGPDCTQRPPCHAQSDFGLRVGWEEQDQRCPEAMREQGPGRAEEAGMAKGACQVELQVPLAPTC
jgi:hypothetical protein